METSTPTTTPGERTRIGAPPVGLPPEADGSSQESAEGGDPGGEGLEPGTSPEGASADGAAQDVGTRSTRVGVPKPGLPTSPRSDRGGAATRAPRADAGTGFESPGSQAPRRKAGDGFRTPGSAPSAASPYLGAGEARGPVLDVESLVPGDLKDLESQLAVGKRFASDGALLAAQVRPSSLPSSDRVARLWAFFAAYAEAAAQHPPGPEGRAAFEQALKDQGFAGLQDAHTGQTGVEAGLWVMDAPTPEEARERADAVRLEPPPDVRHSEQAAPLTPGLYQPLPGPFVRRDEHGRPLPHDPLERHGTDRRLGSRMFWNVLHTFRSGREDEDSALNQAQWDRMIFGAVLAMVGLALAAIALVSSL
ncbi:Immediate early protein ICP0 [Corallococcus sp. Z5C101001]|uniref:Immediate early protein ICP0 n=1 Tax=Corallococcus sp. Z5C101001 TaxID=2596829 RepID=UPI001180F49A|nr:Immediate early protein ICP0 [Corallococcus sp. Z5C101001]TSC28383.1 Immediate early protein ICP0 [Corallococcus sp. Z5C101001]